MSIIGVLKVHYDEKVRAKLLIAGTKQYFPRERTECFFIFAKKKFHGRNVSEETHRHGEPEKNWDCELYINAKRHDIRRRAREMQLRRAPSADLCGAITGAASVLEDIYFLRQLREARERKAKQRRGKEKRGRIPMPKNTGDGDEGFTGVGFYLLST